MENYTFVHTDEVEVTAESEEDALNQLRQAYGVSEDHFELAEVDPIEPIEGPSLEVKFHPEVWVDERAVETDPEGPQCWEVPLEDALSEDGTIVEGNTAYSDELREHERAPIWARNWTGPFYVTIEEFHNLPEGETPDDYME